VKPFKLSRWNAALLTLATAFALQCAKRVEVLPREALTCYDGDGIRWVQADTSADTLQLGKWCIGVGPPVIAETPTTRSVVLDSIAVVVWNTHCGGGDIPVLLSDLRAGLLTLGQPVGDFVLLIQEAFRGGADVPQPLPKGGKHGHRIDAAPKRGERQDIVTVARNEGLNLIYVPSMRNGSGTRKPPEDRGNAILSNLRLSDASAILLPVERQRRVAVAASIEGRTTMGTPWRVRLVNPHLETRSSWSRFGRSFGSGRLRQAKAMIATLDPDEPTIVGGDFNTWVTGRYEPAITFMHDDFERTTTEHNVNTVEGPFILPDRTLDHLFFRIPDAWSARYWVITDEYDSDHYPLVAWVRFGPEQSD